MAHERPEEIDDRGGESARSREMPSAAAGTVGGPAPPVVVRHRWQKLRIHVYICWKCGAGKVNREVTPTYYETTYHLPDGSSIVSRHVPVCAVGPFTEKYLAKYSHVLHDPVPPAPRVKQVDA